MPISKQLQQEIDVTLDQTGAKRPASTIPGAYDVQAEKENSGISAAIAEPASFSLLALGGGHYVVRGAEGVAAVYDLGGRKVVESTVADGDVLDLVGLAGGVYIVNVGNEALKVAL